MKQFLYPFPAERKTHKTFYEHCHSLGIVRLLLGPDLLWKIRLAWWCRHFHQHEIYLRNQKKSESGYPLAFHKKSLVQLVGHLKRFDNLATTYKVPRRSYRMYRSAVLKEILHHATAYYSTTIRNTRNGLVREIVPTQDIVPHSLAVHNVLDIYNSIEGLLATKKISNRKLAEQLTALVCSWQKDVDAGRLDPNPAAVRAAVRHAAKKLAKS